MTDETPPIPDEIDDGLAFAYGEDSAPPSSPSVLERIGEITGSKPKVLLRDESAGDTPMLKPLGPDDRIEAGKYVVQGELGRGGVGTVHKGHDQDLGRDVAMKFLHNKYRDDAAILQRFVEEAQIGGQLQHPGIVPVYDLGLVDGKPFFAMKLVKGQTLAKKLTERESPTDDARTFLSVFEDVCQTLAYAHARGVVHRDLKPANIMIGSFGEVQVVDWGMGKVLASGGVADEKLAAERQLDVSVIETVRSGGHGTQSLVGSMMGTPAYMPPEQARGDVEHMDERSDVFALGAILCEILTGKPPYVGSMDEQIGMAAMAKLDDAYARLEACGGEQEIVELATRCLMPAPAARPRSAEIVAKAVHDHLAGVEARVHEARVETAEAKVRATALKRTQKLGFVLIGVIAAGLLVSLWFWRAADTAATNETIARAAAVASAQEAQHNEQLAVEQTEVAERELARAMEIKTLITEMLLSLNPKTAKGTDITLLKGILDTTSKRLTEDAIEDELVAAELHALTGEVYLSLGLYPAAELHLPVALEIRKRTLGEEHPQTCSSARRLADLYLGQARYAETEPLYLQTLEIRKRVLGEDDPDTMVSMDDLASLYAIQGRNAEAEAINLQTLEIKKQVLGEEHPNTLRAMGNLAVIYDQQGRYAEAEPLYLRTLEIRKRVLGEEHPQTLRSMANLVGLYGQQGNYAEAERLALQTLEIKKRVLGKEHPNTLNSMGNLARVYQKQGRDAEAEKLYRETLEIRKRVLGKEHPRTLTSMSRLAILYSTQGRYAEAELIHLQSLEINKRVLDEEDRNTLGTITNLGALYNSMERFEDAVGMFETSLPIKRRVLGLHHPWTSYAMKGLVTAYLGLGRAEDALPLQRELLGLEVAPADAVDASAETLNGAAQTLLTFEVETLRNPKRALGFAKRACTLAEKKGSDRLGDYFDTLALVQHRTGNSALAVDTQKRAIAMQPAGADLEMAARLAEYEAAAKDH